ncbi:hypothetical protein FDC58_15045 [Clostridium botulinum]|nr:hypothetical protein [Clostridium botulinum]NFH74294.1 hypothetical protein [Clostridium botulinum]NFI02337.1 hypothetical protein [Clostridium botulinum]NFI57828.1 hypothetical protein [Clostridium botulinum]NFI64739.1 hypothetical protein [Clostridium botulinum]
MNIDFKICDILEKKVMTTTGEEQEIWIKKFDIFTNRNLFKQFNLKDKLEEVENIKKEVLKIVQ